MSKPAKIAGLIFLSVLAAAYGVFSTFSGDPDITGGDLEAGFAVKWLNKAFAGKTDYCLKNAAEPLSTRERLDLAIRDAQSLGKLKTRRVKTKSPRGQETVITFVASYDKAPEIEECVGIVKDKDGKLKASSVSFAPPQLPARLPAAKPLQDLNDLAKVTKVAEDWLYRFEQGDQQVLAPLAFSNRKVMNIGKARRLAELQAKRGKADVRKRSQADLQLGIPGDTSLELVRTVYNSQFGQRKMVEMVWLKRDSSSDTPRWEVYDYWTRDAVNRKPR